MNIDMTDLHIDIRDDLDNDVSELPVVKETALGIAERVAAIARSTAPVVSGGYRDGIEAQKTRFGARVFASDYKSGWVEFGVPSRGIPAKFNLRNAAKAAGLKFRKKR